MRYTHEQLKIWLLTHVIAGAADVATTDTYNELYAIATSGAGAGLADNLQQRLAAFDVLVAELAVDETATVPHVMAVINAYSPEAVIKYSK